MTTVRTVAHPGWLVVGGPGVHAVVAAAEGDAEPLEAAAGKGLSVLLEALTSHGLAAAPDFVACARIETGLRVVLRGAAVVVLPDGTRLGAQGRMPWLDVDLDLAQEEVGEVSLEAPEPAPERSRGWQRPARLRRDIVEPAPPVAVSAPTELLPVAGPEVAPASDASSAPEVAAAASDAVPASDTESPATSDEPTHRVASGTLEVPGPTTEFPPTEPVSGSIRPLVPAVLCPAGHPSPPQARRCRTCDREVEAQQPVPTPRPPLGVLRLSTGGSVLLDRGVLLGRAPGVDADQPAGARPHVLRVGGPDRDISRNHAELVLEGWQVLVRDLGSTNGTTVTRPGQQPVRLRPHEPLEIEPGTVVSLAGEVVLSYEVPD